MPTVLVLDAKPDSPIEVRRLLGKLNTVVFEASHFEFAVELLRRGSIGVIVVGDRLFGRHTPLEVLRHLREHHPHLHLVYRASEETRETMPEALAAGADEAVLDHDGDALVAAVGKSLRAA